MRSSCTVPDCGEPMNAHGYCGMHYMRWKRHGDPLFADHTPVGEPERFYQEAVLTCERGADDPCLIWPYSRDAYGYANMSVDGRMQRVHRRVCEDAYGPAPTPAHESAHSCGCGDDGCVTKGHLRWATRTENMADRLLHGPTNRGERHPHTNLTESDVHEIRALIGKMPQSKIAERFLTTQSAVSRIHSRETWGWLT